MGLLNLWHSKFGAPDVDLGEAEGQRWLGHTGLGGGERIRVASCKLLGKKLAESTVPGRTLASPIERPPYTPYSNLPFSTAW